MGVPGPRTIKPIEGLRERKRRQTRERIVASAWSLFVNHGFDATTIDDITTAADVSKRSFFDYFPTKEDVIFAWQDEFASAITNALAARPRDEPLARSLEEALVSSIATASSHPQAIAMSQLIRNTPVLRARDQLKYARLEQKLAEALIERVGDESAYLRLRLLAMIVIGGLRVGGDVWNERGAGESITSYARRVFRTISTELKGFGEG